MINHSERIDPGAFLSENFSSLLAKRLFQQNLHLDYLAFACSEEDWGQTSTTQQS